MPYRRTKVEVERRAPEGSVITELVEQFADRYAFLRELVQNAIDAGTTSVRITISRADDRTCTEVEDDGSGMTREVLEGPLLTMFASTKEGDSTKIGKYGIGFISVFAIGPEEVIVESWRDGLAHRVRLYPDYRFVIERMDPQGGHGTRVQLIQKTAIDEVAGHVERCQTALRKWCRHVQIPIRFRNLAGVPHAHGSTPSDAWASMTEALWIEAAVTIRHEEDGARYVLGPMAGAHLIEGASSRHTGNGAFAGFYHRGITLFESTEEAFPGLGACRFKVDSVTLAHTMSRDNVRRDKAFERCLAVLRGMARRAPELVCQELARVAAEVARGHEDPRLPALLMAAASIVDDDDIVVPLTNPVDGSGTMSLVELVRRTAPSLPVLSSRTADELTAAACAAGIPVVRMAPEALQHLVGNMRRSDHRRRAVDLRRDVAWIRAEKEISAADESLRSELLEALEAIGRSVGSVVFAKGGELLHRSAIVSDRDLPIVLRVEELWRLGHLDGGATLVLLTEHGAIETARSLAKKGKARAAAAMLARVVHLETEGAVRSPNSEALLSWTLQGATT